MASRENRQPHWLPIAEELGLPLRRYRGEAVEPGLRSFSDVTRLAELLDWRVTRVDRAATGSVYIWIERGEDRLTVRWSDHSPYAAAGSNQRGNTGSRWDVRPGDKLGRAIAVLRSGTALTGIAADAARRKK